MNLQNCSTSDCVIVGGNIELRLARLVWVRSTSPEERKLIGTLSFLLGSVRLRDQLPTAGLLTVSLSSHSERFSGAHTWLVDKTRGAHDIGS